ncbi:MAG: Eco57I restriction-modification methylase domain-containing protein [Lutibacter sp.]
MDIKDLVKKYHSNREAYLKADYNETQLRIDFLDPLFEMLEWDIKNSSGKPTNEREVLVEEGLKEDVSSNTKKPDYTFRLFSERKFFLEAKKPRVKIENDNEPAKQIRRYGFTAKLKISALSNFEYLAIYDCSQKVGKDDAVMKSRINIYHYTEYESAFEDIKKQLGHQSVYSGEFDETWKEIEEHLKLSSVDNLFLAQINEWRIILGKEIYSHKPELTVEELNDIVQSYINSIIFLRVCEDRNLETYKTLLNFADNKDFASLIKKFQNADKRYNAGLFNQQLTSKVISDSSSAFWKIIKHLYFPESTYSFSVFASDILGNIYEIFLGEQLAIENGQIILKKKLENVDRDIVTTPIFIIQDILRQTVVEHCKNKTDEEILNSSFADIACGSGAFLLEAYQLIQDILVDYYLANDQTKLIQTSINTYKLPFTVKKAVLENCIWGVDKDYNAVQACKFGLLLKLLENESDASVTVPALPNIDQNIQFGNSLIDSSISTDEKINPFDFGEVKFNVIIGNPPYMATEHIKQLLPTEKPLYEKHYLTAYKQYDKYFLFIERGLSLLKENGYLGYIIPSKFTKVGAGKKLRELLSSKKVIKKIISFGANQVFQDKTTYTSILILSKNENPTFLNTEIKKLSEWKIRDFNSIISEEVETIKLSSDLWFLIPPYLKDTYNHILKQSKNLEDVIGKNNINNGIQTSANDVLILKSQKEDDDFIYFEKNNIPYKIEKGITKPYYETARKKNGIKLNTYRILIPNAKVIFPYKIVKGKVIFIPIKDLKKNFPFAYKYLLAHKKRLTERDIQPVPKTDNEWYRLGRSQYLELGAIKEKIIIGVMSSGEKYPIDFSKTLHTAGGTAGYCSIYLSDSSEYSIYYIQAVLNSRYVEWLIHLRGEVFRGGYIARGTKVLKKIPIRTIDFKNKSDKAIHDKIVNLQKELITIQGKIDTNIGNARKLVPLNRQFVNKKTEMDSTLKVLYNLGESDSLIPSISEMYAIN